MSNRGHLSKVISIEEERHLFQCIAAGDQEAFERFYELSSGYVWGYIVKLIANKEDATDVLQEIYIDLWKNRKGLKHTLYPFGYTLRKTSRFVYHYVRKKSGRDLLKNEQLEMLIPEIYRDTETDDESKEIMGRIELAVRELSEKEQEVFRASRYHGISLREIASKQDLSVRETRRIDEKAMSHVRRILLNGG